MEQTEWRTVVERLRFENHEKIEAARETEGRDAATGNEPSRWKERDLNENNNMSY